MTLSYIEMVMLSGLGYSIYAIFNEDWYGKVPAIICVVCNVFVLSNKLWIYQ